MDCTCRQKASWLQLWRVSLTMVLVVPLVMLEVSTQTTSPKRTGGPYIMRAPTNQTVLLGQRVQFTCGTEAYPNLTTHTWFKDNEDVAASQAFHNGKRISTGEDGSLVIVAVVREDHGWYQCVARNSLGQDQASAFLNVTYLPILRHMPTEVTWLRGYLQHLNCPADANPPVLGATWLKEETRVRPTGRMDILDNGTLIVSDVRDSDAGLYQCTPFNQMGLGKDSPRVRVIIKDEPVFTVAPKVKYILNIGESVRIPCEATGTPAVSMQWSKVGGELDRNSGRVTVTNTYLEIRNVTKDDHGMYECKAINAIANMVKVTTLRIDRTTPHAPFNVTVVPGAFNVTVTWEPAHDGGTPQMYSLRFRRTNQAEWHPMRVSPPSATHFRLHGLLPDTEYQFEVVSTNELGNSSFSERVTQKTLGYSPEVVNQLPTFANGSAYYPPVERNKGPQPTPPRNLTANVKGNDIELRWDLPMNSPVRFFSFKIEYFRHNKWVRLDSIIKGEQARGAVINKMPSGSHDLRLLACGTLACSLGSNVVRVDIPDVGMKPPGNTGASSSSSNDDLVLPEALVGGIVGGILFLLVAILLALVAIFHSRKKDRKAKAKKYNDVTYGKPDEVNGRYHDHPSKRDRWTNQHGGGDIVTSLSNTDSIFFTPRSNDFHHHSLQQQQQQDQKQYSDDERNAILDPSNLRPQRNGNHGGNGGRFVADGGKVSGHCDFESPDNNPKPGQANNKLGGGPGRLVPLTEPKHSKKKTKKKKRKKRGDHNTVSSPHPFPTHQEDLDRPDSVQGRYPNSSQQHLKSSSRLEEVSFQSDISQAGSFTSRPLTHNNDLDLQDTHQESHTHQHHHPLPHQSQQRPALLDPKNQTWPTLPSYEDRENSIDMSYRVEQQPLSRSLPVNHLPYFPGESYPPAAVHYPHMAGGESGTETTGLAIDDGHGPIDSRETHPRLYHNAPTSRSQDMEQTPYFAKSYSFPSREHNNVDGVIYNRKGEALLPQQHTSLSSSSLLSHPHPPPYHQGLHHHHPHHHQQQQHSNHSQSKAPVSWQPNGSTYDGSSNHYNNSSANPVHQTPYLSNLPPAQHPTFQSEEGDGAGDELNNDSTLIEDDVFGNFPRHPAVTRPNVPGFPRHSSLKPSHKTTYLTDDAGFPGAGDETKEGNTAGYSNMSLPPPLFGMEDISSVLDPGSEQPSQTRTPFSGSFSTPGMAGSSNYPSFRANTSSNIEGAGPNIPPAGYYVSTGDNTKPLAMVTPSQKQHHRQQQQIPQQVQQQQQQQHQSQGDNSNTSTLSSGRPLGYTRDRLQGVLQRLREAPHSRSRSEGRVQATTRPVLEQSSRPRSEGPPLSRQGYYPPHHPDMSTYSDPFPQSRLNLYDGEGAGDANAPRMSRSQTHLPGSDTRFGQGRDDYPVPAASYGYPASREPVQYSPDGSHGQDVMGYPRYGTGSNINRYPQNGRLDRNLYPDFNAAQNYGDMRGRDTYLDQSGDVNENPYRNLPQRPFVDNRGQHENAHPYAVSYNDPQYDEDFPRPRAHSEGSMLARAPPYSYNNPDSRGAINRGASYPDMSLPRADKQHGNVYDRHRTEQDGSRPGCMGQGHNFARPFHENRAPPPPLRESSLQPLHQGSVSQHPSHQHPAAHRGGFHQDPSFQPSALHQQSGPDPTRPSMAVDPRQQQQQLAQTFDPRDVLPSRYTDGPHHPAWRHQSSVSSGIGSRNTSQSTGSLQHSHQNPPAPNHHGSNYSNGNSRQGSSGRGGEGSISNNTKGSASFSSLHTEDPDLSLDTTSPRGYNRGGKEPTGVRQQPSYSRQGIHRRDTSGDENYEFDSINALENDIMDDLRRYSRLASGGLAGKEPSAGGSKISSYDEPPSHLQGRKRAPPQQQQHLPQHKFSFQQQQQHPNLHHHPYHQQQQQHPSLISNKTQPDSAEQRFERLREEFKAYRSHRNGSLPYSGTGDEDESIDGLVHPPTAGSALPIGVNGEPLYPMDSEML